MIYVSSKQNMFTKWSNWKYQFVSILHNSIEWITIVLIALIGFTSNKSVLSKILSYVDLLSTNSHLKK